MQFQPLPTPFDVAKRVWESFLDLLIILLILLVMSTVTQVVIAVSGLLIAITGHWIIGGILIVIAAVATSIRKASRF
jgi:hypothetical protein